MTSTSDSVPRFVADISRVKEVILAGSADFDFWLAKLSPLGLTPVRDHGSVLLLLSATKLRWMGKRFSEFTVSVAVCEQGDCLDSRAFYLVRAFNSSRLLAWMERTFFKTPYFPAAIQVSDQPPARILLGQRDGLLLQAAMALRRTPAIPEEQVWEGRIWLPKTRSDRRLHFFAHLSGETQIFPSVEADMLEINAQSDDRVFQWLRESKFTPVEWRLRSNARHARSATTYESNR